jgi:hypothetical protein
VPSGGLYSGSGLARRNLAQNEALRRANTPCSGFFGRKNKIGWISLTKGASPPAVHPPFFVVVSEMRSALSERNLLTTSNPILGNIASARGICSPSHHCHTPIAHFTTFIAHFATFIAHFATFIAHFATFIAHFATFIAHFATFIAHFATFIAHFATFASRTRGSPRLMRLIRQLDSVQEGASRIPCASANSKRTDLFSSVCCIAAIACAIVLIILWAGTNRAAGNEQQCVCNRLGG